MSNSISADSIRADSAPPHARAEAHKPALSHDVLYRHARIYDLAFSYRDFPREVDFLESCVRRFGNLQAWGSAGFLELAAGPGMHALEAARRGVKSTALDLSPEMMQLCAARAREEGLQVRTLVADMQRFTVETPAALAFNPLTSISYLTTLDALREHMRAVRDALVPGGLYVVENNHPNDFFRAHHFQPSTWRMQDGDLSVETTWIAETPRIDGARQLYEAVGRYVVDDRDGRRVIEDRAWLRMTLPAELELAGALAGLELCAQLGDLSLDAPLDDEGWRAVLVLRRPA